ncbi:MAG TPA: SDR family oxidoreductase [Gemmatimonadaceae bacterium]
MSEAVPDAASAVAPALPLDGRSALVTGASRGIGLAIARRLVIAGARVLCLARSRDALEREASAMGALASPLPCDLSRPDEVDRAVQQVRDLIGDTPDILVQNAGLFALAPVEATSAEAFQQTLTTNLAGPYRLLHAFLPGMRARHSGHVVTIGSIADRLALPGNVAYAASKFAARAVHQVMREELRGSGVRVSLVSPGPVDTTLWDAIDPDRRPDLTPRARMLRPEAVADAVLWVVTRPADVNIDELRLGRA